MRRLTTGAAAGFLLFMAGTVTAAPAPKTMMLNLTTVTDAQGMHVNVGAKVWVKGDKARVEANEPMTGPTIRLVNGAKVYTLYPQQKRGSVATIPAGKGSPKNPMEFIVANVAQVTRSARKTGQQTIDGYPCDIYQLTRKEEGGTMVRKAWITRATQPRLPLKVEETIQVRRPNMTVNQSRTTKITGLKIGVPIPDSLFVLPSGYRIVEGGPGGPGLPNGPGMGVPGMGH